MLTALAAVGLAVLLGGCDPDATVSAGAARSSPTVDRPSALSVANTARVGGLTFSLPPGAQYVRPTFTTGAIVVPVGWIINQAPKPECDHSGCGAPYATLSARQFGVGFFASPEEAKLQPNARIAGLPARFGGPVGGSCSRGFSVQIETSWAPHRGSDPKGSALQIYACLGSSDPGLRRTVRRMITGARR